MKILILFLFSFFIKTISEQSNYNKTITKHRANYKKEFLTDEHSPLKTKKDLSYLDFYKPNIKYKTTASFTRVLDLVGFEILTHSNKKKHYYKYGKCEFQLKDTFCTLYVYQSKDLMQKDELKDYLFVPFTDNTNGINTFGGGRYLDFKINDIQNNQLEIDFNKAYNPYCMYATGYNCPIPPEENKLNIAIEAGEKLFKKKIEH